MIAHSKKILLALFTLASLQSVFAMEKPQDEINKLTTQLSKALKINDLVQAKQLMAAGADPKCGYIALEVHLERHIEQNHLETVQWLIDLGASVNPGPGSIWSRNLQTVPALITAARFGDEKMCTLLINAKAQINETLLGYNVLWHAIYNNRVELVKLLISHGANSPRNNIVEIPFPPNGILDPSFEPMQELLNQHDISIHPRSEEEQRKINSWLWYGIKDYDVDMAQYTIALGANVNDDRNRIPPLFLALQNGWQGRKFVKLLLRNGANPNLKAGYNKDETPLIHMIDYIQYSHDFCEESYQLLISYGANVNATDSKGATALRYAADFGIGSKLICKALLRDGAQINMRNLNNETALHLAAKNNCKSTCKLFLNHARTQSKGILLFLVWLRKNHYTWYQQRCVLRPYLEPFTLDFLLKVQDIEGNVAFNYWEVPELLPYSIRPKAETHENN